MTSQELIKILEDSREPDDLPIKLELIEPALNWYNKLEIKPDCIYPATDGSVIAEWFYDEGRKAAHIWKTNFVYYVEVGKNSPLKSYKESL
jgi:hypothetical protein